MPTSTSPALSPLAPATKPVIAYAGGASAGVAVMAPPEALLPSIAAAVAKACEAIPAGRTGALVAIADTKGANLAVVQRIGTHVEIMGWIGKSWGEPIAGGASVHASW
jgi:hypothetical protein